MAHPYHKHAHKKDPKWLRGLDPLVEKAREADIADTIRNYGGDREVSADAAYESPKEET